MEQRRGPDAVPRGRPVSGRKECEDRTCGECDRCADAARADAARVFQAIADKRAGKPAPAILTINYGESPFFKLLKKGWQP